MEEHAEEKDHTSKIVSKRVWVELPSCFYCNLLGLYRKSFTTSKTQLKWALVFLGLCCLQVYLDRCLTPAQCASKWELFFFVYQGPLLTILPSSATLETKFPRCEPFGLQTRSTPFYNNKTNDKPTQPARWKHKQINKGKSLMNLLNQAFAWYKSLQEWKTQRRRENWRLLCWV